MLEFGLGHMTRQAAPGAFAKIHPRLQWFGWFAVGVGFVICTYYAVIMGWCMNYTWESVNLGWEDRDPIVADTTIAICPTDLGDGLVLTPVPDSLEGRPYTSPSGTRGTVASEPTSVVAHAGSLIAFPTTAQARAFMRSPFLPGGECLGAAGTEETAMLPGVPDDLLGIPYVSPLTSPAPGQSWVVSRTATLLVAQSGHLYAFPDVASASEYLGSPENFFYNRFLGLTSHPWDMGTFRWPILIGFTLSWIWIIASIWKSTKTVGKVVFYTVTIPWLLLIVFMIRGMTLDGAGEGLRFYLTPEWARLADPGIWLAAITQIFFSLSVGFGIMIAYGSFLPGKTNIAANAMIIGIADSLTAFCGGIAVFSALGHQAHRLGVPVSEVVQSGPGLAFVAYPQIISSLPLAPVFGVLFFVMLLTLAIDSAFSLVEAATSAVRDKWGVSHRRSNLTVGITSFLLGLPMLTGSGLHILDIVDHFMNFWGLTLVVLGQTIIVGWAFGADRMRKHINQNSSFRIGAWWDICVRWLLPMSIFWMLYSEIRERAVPYGSFGLRSQEFLFGWLIIILLPIVADVFASLQGRKQTQK
jgi:neurotransmitter:Na+ symporter, NSS family